MKVTIAAFLFTERNMKVYHKKSSEKFQSSNLFKLNELVSKSSRINEIVKVITKTNHEAVSSITLDVRQSKVIGSSDHEFVESYFYNGRNAQVLVIKSVLNCSVAYPERECIDLIRESRH